MLIVLKVSCVPAQVDADCNVSETVPFFEEPISRNPEAHATGASLNVETSGTRRPLLRILSVMFQFEADGPEVFLWIDWSA